ncbi:MAG: hypothetical protein V3T21_06885 [Candidatus Margulisiibacteriota bacterium]
MAIEFDTGGLANVRKYTINDLPQRIAELGKETGDTMTTRVIDTDGDGRLDTSLADKIQISSAAREEGAVYVEAKKAKNAKSIVPKGVKNA